MDATFEASTIIAQHVVTAIILVDDEVKAGDPTTEAAIVASSRFTVRRAHLLTGPATADSWDSFEVRVGIKPLDLSTMTT